MATCTDEKLTIENVIQNMCIKIAKTDVIVKSQQRDEPDLTIDQKVEILKDILAKKPAVFLARFGKELSLEELLYFESIENNDYELEFRLKELQKLSNEKRNHVKIQNRRYEALTRMTKDSDYFNESEMRKRNPLLYEQYIGQYLTDEERQARDTAEQPRDPSLSDILIQRFDSQQTEWIYQYQQEKEGTCEEEEESDDSTADDNNITEESPVSSPFKGVPNDNEKQLLREEFLSIMQTKFLTGQETDFDYRTVDTSDEYDDLKLRERDEEEEYFDQDD